jgi:hypothetical protein
MRAGIVLALALTACATAEAQQTSGSLDWMSGYWLSCEEGVQTVESWIGAGGGTMLGANLTRTPGRPEAYVFLRIAQNTAGGRSYYSMPGGRSPPTEFALTELSGQRATFANPAHDFPQRIIYWREGDVMHARIEGEMEGRAESMEWRWNRAAQDASCPR